MIDADTTRAGNQDFHFVEGGRPFFGSAGDLWAEQDAAKSQKMVYGDVNGDGVADLAIRLNGLRDLDASDFVL